MTQITDIPHDPILRVFEFLLPTSPPHPVKPSGVGKFFATTSPYNVEKVSRSWRETAQSSGTLWTTLLLAFRGLSTPAMKKLINLVQKHLRLSKNMTLTCSIHLQGEPQALTWKKIIAALSKHQHRWRSMSFWFEDFDPGNRLKSHVTDWRRHYFQRYDRSFYELRTVRLDSRDLTLLEELCISHSGAYVFKYARSNPLLSLKRLHIGIKGDYDGISHWLELAPNLDELTVIASGQFYSEEAINEEFTYSGDFRIQRTGIRSLRLASDGVGKDVVNACVLLREMSAASLTHLDVYLDFSLSARQLHGFLSRSKPTALERCRISLPVNPSRRSDDEAFSALELVPSVKHFIIQSDSLTCLGALETSALEVPPGATSAFAVFPNLETLEIVGAIALPEDFLRVSLSRGPRLSRIKLTGCRFKLEDGVGDSRNPDYEEESSSRRILLFERGADSSTLPSEFKDLEPLMSMGLEFEVTDEVDKGPWL